MKPDQSDKAWAARGRWLFGQMTERSTPDGRCLLELVDVPIWAHENGTEEQHVAAIDAEMERDESDIDHQREAAIDLIESGFGELT